MSDKNIVKIDADLAGIMPGYLKNRRADLAEMTILLKRDDYEALRIIGHKMRGSGGGYGFQKLSVIGEAIENAAMRKDRDELQRQSDELKFFLDTLEIIYEPSV